MAKVYFTRNRKKQLKDCISCLNSLYKSKDCEDLNRLYNELDILLNQINTWIEEW